MKPKSLGPDPENVPGGTAIMEEEKIQREFERWQWQIQAAKHEIQKLEEQGYEFK